MYVRKLNLSYNNLKTVDFKQLPYALEEVNLSYNELEGYILVEKKGQLYMEDTIYPKSTDKLKIDRVTIKRMKLYYEKIDLSNNKIDSIYVKPEVKNLNVSYNNLTYLNLNVFFNIRKSSPFDTLNISNNEKLNSVLLFDPKLFKKVYHKNIKNDQPLEFRLFN